MLHVVEERKGQKPERKIYSSSFQVKIIKVETMSLINFRTRISNDLVILYRTTVFIRGSPNNMWQEE